MEVNIQEDFSTQTVKMIFYDMDERSKRVYNLYTGESTQVEEGMVIPEEFIMKVPGYMANALLKSLAEALSERGVKTKMDATMEGQLDATKYHLEDLRKLLKIK